MFLLLDLAVAFLLDILIGDPRWVYHPVRAIGGLISLLERVTRKIIANEYLAGIITVLMAVTISVAIVFASLVIAYLAGGIVVFHIVNVIWLYFGISGRDLAKAARRVEKDLQVEDLTAARESVAMLVSRETGDFDEAQISSSTIESVAENTVDGVISPLLFAAIGGAPLMWLFKAINTCDSMLGYKNERYLKFGFFAAKLDDVANWIPARISLLITVIAAWISGFSSWSCWKIAWRDARNDDSPNSGISEASAAGALQVRLGGTAIYDGKIMEKKPFGEEFSPPGRNDILRSLRLMWACSWLGLIIALLIHWPLVLIVSAI